MKLPPLNSVRVFEIAGRHASFKEAAAELNITAGAVSRQIALLEDYLGIALFHRLHREVILTAEGETYFGQVADLLKKLSSATESVKKNAGTGPLHISCPMTFSMRWLIPRLRKYQSNFPECEVTFSTALAPMDHLLNDADIAIRIGTGNWPNLVSHKIMDIELTPVCSPKLLRGARLNDPDLLRNHTLLHSLVHPNYWQIWLDANAMETIDGQKGTKFGSVSLAYQMAMEGHGIAIAQHALVAEDIESGSLVMPFENAVVIEDAFYLIYSSSQKNKYYVSEFKEWLIQEARQFEQNRHRIANWS